MVFTDLFEQGFNGGIMQGGRQQVSLLGRGMELKVYDFFAPEESAGAEAQGEYAKINCQQASHLVLDTLFCSFTGPLQELLEWG